jgi:hypothetical protein
MKNTKITQNPYFFLNQTAVFLKYATLDFTFSETCEPEADVKIALNIYLFFEPGKRIFDLCSGFIYRLQNLRTEAVMQFALNTHFFLNPLSLFLIVSGAGGSFEKSENCRKLLFVFETGSRIFMYMATEFTACDLLEPRGM